MFENVALKTFTGFYLPEKLLDQFDRMTDLLHHEKDLAQISTLELFQSI